VAITVIIADDHEVIRRGLTKLLEDEGLTVVAEAVNGREAIAKVNNSTYVARAAALGAQAFLAKDVPARVFVSTIQLVACGQEPTGDARLRTMKAALEQRPDPAADEVPLTKREYQVLLHLARGLSDREVASSLGISVETVKGYVRLVMLKLRTRDRTEAAVWAAKRGLV
jgi:DNA-binding NarL/FixJ family response regulator